MPNYRIAFCVNGKQLNTWFSSAVEFKDDETTKSQFRELAIMAVKDYLKEARSVPQTGKPEAFALWPETLPSEGPIQPLDAFEITD